MVNLNDRVDKLVFAQNEIPCVTSITPCVLISIQIAYDYLHKQIFPLYDETNDEITI